MLARHYRSERSVSFYTSRLCISTKYIAKVVKDVSGKIPVAWIKNGIVSEIEYQLLYSQATIKKIAWYILKEFQFISETVKGFTLPL